MGRIQRQVTMLPQVWKLVDDNYEQLEYDRPNLLIEDCILYCFSNRFSKKLSKSTKACAKSFKKVGKIADEVKDILFLANAGKIFKKTIRDLDAQVKAGLITQKNADFIIERLMKKLKESGIELVARHMRRDKKEIEKRKKAFLKKYPRYKVTKSGKIKKA